MFLKTIPLSSPCKLQKREFAKMLTLHVDITCSVYRYVCKHVEYWYHKEILSVIFTDLYKHCFINVAIYTKLFKNTKNNSAVFIISLSYKHTLCFLSKVTKILLPLLNRRHTIKCPEKFYSLINCNTIELTNDLGVSKSVLNRSN